MLIDAPNLSALRDNVNTRFQAGFARTAGVWGDQVAMTIPSTTETETYAWMEGIPGFREWVGERVAHDLRTRAYQVINKLWEDTLRLPRTKISDDKFGIYGAYAETLGQKARKHPDFLLWQMLKSGKSSVCYDGQYFFDTDHPVDIDDATSGVLVNLFTARPLAGANAAANFDAVRTAMRQYKLGRKDPITGTAPLIGVNPTHVLVGPDLQMAAETLFGTPSLANGATNPMAGAAKVIVLPELDEAGVWYVADLSMPIKPLIWQEREAVQWDALFDPSSDHVFKFDEFLFGGRMRGNAGLGLWFLIARCEPT